MSCLRTSEAVSRGHPDKIADQIADAVLDAYLAGDTLARVACEVIVMHDLIVVGGEVGSETRVEIAPLIRALLREIGYDGTRTKWDGGKVEILDKLTLQSPEIARAVCKGGGVIGAGDQGIMSGFATCATASGLPLAHEIALSVIRALEQDIAQGRQDGNWDSPLLPDAKCQVTVQFNGSEPEHLHTLVVSSLHRADVSLARLRDHVRETILPRVASQYPRLFSAGTNVLINPAGTWHLGGPSADTGLTGRKTVSDSYGPDVPIGGGSFSGKDPTKVDRSAAYAARHAARNLVAAGLADQATVQLAYAIGMPQPVALSVCSGGTSRHLRGDEGLTDLLRATVDFSPGAIIDRFDLRRPLYAATAAGGHFGRDSFPWEFLELVDRFREQA